MTDIEPKVKPLYRDLKELNIGNYLASIDFDRHALKSGLEKIWNQAIEAFDRENSIVIIGHDMTSYDREEALRILMNWTIRSSQSDFNSIISIILSGFIEWSNHKSTFEKIFEDLELAGMPIHLIAELKKKYFSKLKIINSLHESLNKENLNIEKQTIHSPNEFIESNKAAWIDQISKAKIQATLDEIKNFAQEISDLDLTKRIIRACLKISYCGKVNPPNDH